MSNENDAQINKNFEMGSVSTQVWRSNAHKSKLCVQTIESLGFRESDR